MDDMLRAKLLLFAQMTDEPAFDQLRSKEQLGYVVWSGARYSATTIGYRVIIQSERTAEYLESRIDNFLIQTGETLENMSEKDFEGHKRSVINKRLEKLKNLSSETSRFWSHIGSEYFDFLQNESDAANVRGLTKGDIVDFYKQLIDPRSPTRGKLSIYLNAQGGAHAKVEGTDQQSRLVSLLGKQLEGAGFAVDTSRLSSVFESADLSASDADQILAVLKKFLLSEMSLSEQQTAPVLEQARQNIGLHAKQLGIETADKDSKPVTNGVGKPKTDRKVTYITNVPEFKARMVMSAGPIAVTDITEFEDFDAKL
jgi:insulysin